MAYGGRAGVEPGGDLTPGEAIAAKRVDLIAGEENAGASDRASALRAVGAGKVQAGDNALADDAPFQLGHGQPVEATARILETWCADTIP